MQHFFPLKIVLTHVSSLFKISCNCCCCFVFVCLLFLFNISLYTYMWSAQHEPRHAWDCPNTGQPQTKGRTDWLNKKQWRTPTSMKRTRISAQVSHLGMRLAYETLETNHGSTKRFLSKEMMTTVDKQHVEIRLKQYKQDLTRNEKFYLSLFSP